jgi:hypothetical protein
VDSMDGSEDAVDPLPLYEDVEELPEYDGEGEGEGAGDHLPSYESIE